MKRLIAVVLLTISLVAPPSVSAARTAPTPVDGHGLTVVDTARLDDRIVETTVSTDALEEPVRVRVVLPEGYERSRKRYPVLYLFHGTSGRPSDWTEAGEAVESTAGHDVIVVLPEAGFDGNGGGWFVDWLFPDGAKQMWETFHIEQVIPWVDANYRTLASRDHRAVAGLSQGGFGAMHAAARHPELFTSVATFSGAPEIFRDPVVRLGASAVIEGTNVAFNGGRPFQMFGDPVLNATHWQGHDPGTLVGNLRGMDVNMWTATGLPGQLDTIQTASLPNIVIETLTHASTMAFHRHLRQAGIDHHLNNYVFGTHSFPYWARDLREYLPRLMDRFANPSRPDAITYAATAKQYDQWDWNVTVHRRATERLTSINDASSAGFRYEGFDRATITTPRLYRPRSTHQVRITRGLLTTKTQSRADSKGRLTIDVPGTARVSID